MKTIRLCGPVLYLSYDMNENDKTIHLFGIFHPIQGKLVKQTKQVAFVMVAGAIGRLVCAGGRNRIY